MPSHYKIRCPFCGGEIKVPAERIGELSTCEHCQQEITLDLPNYDPNRMAYSPPSPATLAVIQQKVSPQMIRTGYWMAVLFPIIGFVLGIYFLTKDRFDHGIGCMVVSLVASGIWWGILAAMI